ncbi:MAG: CRISPR-associated endonuclease Cas3'' [Sphaerochaetaceae bacterium]|nr:CRISPR-associated endonuclease Cas3'' [Sphaerochaetaceae bacterium]
MLAKRYDDGKEETVAEHMRCTADVAFDQYERLPQGVKNMMPSREFCVFCAAIHDIGKASPIFQAHIKYGKGHNKPQHWMISYKILIDSGFDETICQFVAVHHGNLPESKILNAIRGRAYNDECGSESEEYALVQAELLNFAIRISGIDLSSRRRGGDPFHRQTN